MAFPHELLEFIHSHRGELTLSVYTASAPADPAARRNWRVNLRREINDERTSLSNASADEQDAFERCAAEVLSRLPSGASSSLNLGWACFATASGGALDMHLHDATAPSITWGPGAQVVPRATGLPLPFSP